MWYSKEYTCKQAIIIIYADYLKHLPNTSPDFGHEDMDKALKIVSEVASHANDTIRNEVMQLGTDQRFYLKI